MKKKKTILIDLDGVLNQYNGNFNPDLIPEIKDGAKDFLKILHQDFNIKILTTRDISKTIEWLIQNDIEKYISGVTNTKEPAFLQIDDRCICFDGNFDNTICEIQKFKPWYK
jgi:hypothetical protein